MFAAPAGNPFGASFYGSAAISEALGGGNWMSEGCGTCWKVTGTSNAGSVSRVETTLVLKGTNFCPPGNAPVSYILCEHVICPCVFVRFLISCLFTLFNLILMSV